MPFTPFPRSWSRTRSTFCLLLLCALLLLLAPQNLPAEDSLWYKFQSWQEDDGRIRVDAHYALAEKDLSLATKFKLSGVIDTIVGATPTGEPPATTAGPVPLVTLQDRREAWQAELTHQFSRTNVGVSGASSRESDYRSKAVALNTQTDFNQRNSLLLLGVAYTDDEVQPRFFSEAREKQGVDAIIGLTQLLDSHTSVVANLSWGRVTGYLSEPYKIVSKTTEILPGLSLPLTFPENRPSDKEKLIFLAGLNRRFDRLNGAIDLSWRYYDDTFGIASHTLNAEWFQRFGSTLVVRPAVRFYQQDEADFYVPRLDDVPGLVPAPRATGQAPYYSSDYRMAAMRTWTVGLKLVWEARPWLSIDATIERYLMESRDARTSASAFVDADIYTVGIRLWR